MVLKILFFLSALAVSAYGGIVASPLSYVAPFASSVASHVTHHSVAAPYVAAPVAAPLVSAPIAAPIPAPVLATTRVASPLVGQVPLVL